MAPDPSDRYGRSKTLREHIVDGLKEAQKRRPASFYMLLITPVVLLLGVKMAEYRDEPWQFAGMLTLLFLFCGAVLLMAVLDIFEISRRHFREHRDAFRETLADENLYKKLASRTDQPRGE